MKKESMKYILEIITLEELHFIKEKKTGNKSDIIRLVDRRFFNNLKFDLNHKIIIKIDVEGQNTRL